MALSHDIKVCLLGDCGVGKTSIASRFVGEEFQEQNISTIGQEKYNALVPLYYRDTQAAILVYDITKESSYQRCLRWVKELARCGSSDTIIAIVGNKLDKENNRKVERSVSERHAQMQSAIFYETSAKTSANINQLFYEIGAKYVDRLAKKHLQQRYTEEAVNLVEVNRRKGCCPSKS